MRRKECLISLQHLEWLKTISNFIGFDVLSFLEITPKSQEFKVLLYVKE